MKLKMLIPLLIVSLLPECSQLKDESNSAKALLARLMLRRGSRTINAALPTNFAIAVPRSIRKTSSSGSSNVREAEGSDRNIGYSARVSPTPATLISDGKSGNGYLTEQTDLIAQILQDSKLDLMLISGIFDVAKASPGVCISGGTSTVAITQDQIDEIVSGLQDLGLSNDEAKAQLQSFQEDGSLPSVGDSLPTPAIVYTTLTDNPDYNVQIDYTVNGTIANAQACPKNNKYSKTIKFKTDLSQVYASVSKSINGFGTLIEISANITKFSKPNTKDKSVMNMTQVITPKRGAKNKSTSDFTMEQCSADDAANTKNCISMKLNTVGDANGKKVTIKVVGKTDDTGGYVKTTFDDKTATPNVKYDLEETYDTDGNITYMSAKEGSSPTLYFGTFDSAEYGEFYQTSYSFEGEVFLTIQTFVDIGIDAGYDTFDEFVIIPAGFDPNVTPDQILGFGIFYDTNGDLTPTSSEVSIAFFGLAADVPTAKVWRTVYDANFNVTYAITLDTLSVIP